MGAFNKLLKHKIVVALALLSLFVVPLAVPAVVEAGGASTQQACEAIGGNWNGNSCTGTGAPSLQNTIRTVVNVFSVVVGIVAVIMIIYGGFSYITAGGDSGKLASARSTIVYAIIGLIIVGVSQGVVFFVLEQVG